jgi:hypothetical protein
MTYCLFLIAFRRLTTDVRHLYLGGLGHFESAYLRVAVGAVSPHFAQEGSYVGIGLAAAQKGAQVMAEGCEEAGV